MKWIAEIEQEITLTKSVVVEAKTLELALVLIHDYTLHMSGVVGSDECDWDECEADEDVYLSGKAVRLLDRRTAERRDPDVLRDERSCDNCDDKDVHTVPYGDARVCNDCLAMLPPLNV